MSAGDIVVDASALLRLFFREEGEEKVLQVVEKAEHQRRSVFLNVINYGEVYYSVRRKIGEEGWLEWRARMDRLPLTIYPVSISLVEEAAELKIQYQLPYADAFCVATALREKASVLTGDKDFQRVEKVVQILWAR